MSTRKATELSRIIDHTQRSFRLCGLRIAEDDEFKRQPANSLETLFDKHMQVYTSYMQDTRTFEHAATSDLLARQGIVCPDFTYDIFATCMRYAVEKDWGRNQHIRHDP